VLQILIVLLWHSLNGKTMSKEQRHTEKAKEKYDAKRITTNRQMMMMMIENNVMIVGWLIDFS
jgi:preprotein translocase subunit Sec63